MLGRSHVTLAGATYLALLMHPLETPWGHLTAPVLRATQPGAEGAVTFQIALALSLGVVGLASLFPDVDHADSAVAGAAGFVSLVLARGVQRVLHHRGPLHSALAVLLAGALGELLGTRLGVAGAGALAGYGWATHILADAATDRGVPLFWPLRRRRIRPPFGPRLATGSRGEALAVLAGVLACGWWAAIPFATRGAAVSWWPPA